MPLYALHGNYVNSKVQQHNRKNIPSSVLLETANNTQSTMQKLEPQVKLFEHAQKNCVALNTKSILKKSFSIFFEDSQ